MIGLPASRAEYAREGVALLPPIGTTDVAPQGALYLLDLGTVRGLAALEALLHADARLPLLLSAARFAIVWQRFGAFDAFATDEPAALARAVRSARTLERSGERVAVFAILARDVERALIKSDLAAMPAQGSC